MCGIYAQVEPRVLEACCYNVLRRLPFKVQTPPLPLSRSFPRSPYPHNPEDRLRLGPPHVHERHRNTENGDEGGKEVESPLGVAVTLSPTVLYRVCVFY